MAKERKRPTDINQLAKLIVDTATGAEDTEKKSAESPKKDKGKRK